MIVESGQKKFNPKISLLKLSGSMEAEAEVDTEVNAEALFRFS